MSQERYNFELEKNHDWNSRMNILEATFFQIGMAGLTPAIIIVAFLKHYTDNELILNLPVFIANFSMSLGPFIVSFFSGKVRGKKRAASIAGLLQRIFLIPLILIAYFMSGSKWIVPVFLTAYTVFYMVWGGGSIFWQEMIGRALAPGRFTSAMGARESLSRIAGFLSSLVVVAILGSVAFPNNFLVLFTMCFVFCSFSLQFIFRIKEAPYDELSSAKPSRHLRNILSLPVRDKAFKWYMIFILFFYGYLFVGGLYTVTGIERFRNVMGQDRLTGIIGALTVLSASLFSFGIGKICERIGKLWGFAFFALLNTALPLSMMLCNNFYLYLVLIFLSGINNSSWFLEISMLMGFSVPEKRHEYIAYNSLLKLIPIFLYTNLGGLLASTISHEAAFIMSSAFCLISLFILVFKLRYLFADEMQL
jgi:MFS family permease